MRPRNQEGRALRRHDCTRCRSLADCLRMFPQSRPRVLKRSFSPSTPVDDLGKLGTFGPRPPPLPPRPRSAATRLKDDSEPPRAEMATRAEKRAEKGLRGSKTIAILPVVSAQQRCRSFNRVSYPGVVGRPYNGRLNHQRRAGPLCSNDRFCEKNGRIFCSNCGTTWLP
jgi:hypothetical protein